MLRKPDFQRATNAWSPEECVDLLESVIKEKVVPSVIMWLSPNGLHYVLDGGHRISVVIAWVADDWGDGPGVTAIDDVELKERAAQSAKEVRLLIERRGLGTYRDHAEAYRDFVKLELEDRGNPKDQLGLRRAEMAVRFRRWRSMNIGFPILWVQGDYKTAEESFIKINKTGQRLSEWETKLVEHRTSCAARLIMSIAQREGSLHCWPEKELAQEEDRERVRQIVTQVSTARERVLFPRYHLPIDDCRQPLLGISPGRPDLVAPYVAEMLTVAVGNKRGLPSDTEELLKKTKAEDAVDIVREGWNIISEFNEAVEHIYGTSSRSMLVMPLVYFYNEDGACIRALLYGFIYWIREGDDDEIKDRKTLFSGHRAKFEEAILEYKGDLIKRISRRIGSGPEVTIQVSRYYNGLLRLIMQGNSDVKGLVFRQAHRALLEELDVPKEVDVSPTKLVPEKEQPRAFRGRTRQRIKIEELITTFTDCGICGGYCHPTLAVEMDHKVPWSQGGTTTKDNGRSVHPFCNNRRKQIEEIRGGKSVLKQPKFEPRSAEGEKLTQLVFLSAMFDKDAEPLWWSVEGKADPNTPEATA